MDSNPLMVAAGKADDAGKLHTGIIKLLQNTRRFKQSRRSITLWPPPFTYSFNNANLFTA
jgi:hypothetical protein